MLADQPGASRAFAPYDSYHRIATGKPASVDIAALQEQGGRDEADGNSAVRGIV